MSSRFRKKAASITDNDAFEIGSISSNTPNQPLVVLVGPPGVGKSTIGKQVAKRLGVSFLDTDDAIAANAGMPVPDIFQRAGEPGFRRLEIAAVKAALHDCTGVLSLGGGAVMAGPTQMALADYVSAGGHVVFLDVTAAGVAPRIAAGGRPLLAGANAMAKWRALADGRRGGYHHVSNHRIDTTNLTPDEVATRIVKLTTKPADRVAKVTVAVAPPYEVLIGKGLIDKLPAFLPPGVNKVFLIRPEPLAAIAAQAIKALEGKGFAVIEQIVPDGEAQKTAAIAAQCWERAGLAAITRSDAVVGLGGGATTDLAGFVAATWLRGVALVQVATTLLGMVDAAVGGKTGINTAEGKNLVGSFYQPTAVLCDLAMLATLPERDFTAGLAEVIKCGLIADSKILDLIEKHAAALTPWRGDVTDKETWAVVAELVRRAIAVKAEVTANDPTEKGQREFLNYGHTLGHAIEHGEHFTWRHGEAVAVGMVFAAELARLAGKLSKEEVARHRTLLKSVGLPITYQGATLSELLPAMARDKKARGTKLRFIILDGIGTPTRLADPAFDVIQQAFNGIAHST